MKTSVKTLDLLHNYLTESRILGIYRTEKNVLKMRHSSGANIELATISASETTVRIDSTYFKEGSMKDSCKIHVELTNPLGLETVLTSLKIITKNFNKFAKLLLIHKESIRTFFFVDKLELHVLSLNDL